MIHEIGRFGARPVAIPIAAGGDQLGHRLAELLEAEVAIGQTPLSTARYVRPA